MLEFKVSFKTQLSALFRLINLTILSILTVFLIGLFNGFNADLFMFFSFFYVLNLILVLYLHFQYFLANRKTIFIINDIDNQFILKTKHDVEVIKFSNVDKIDIYMVPS